MDYTIERYSRGEERPLIKLLGEVMPETPVIRYNEGFWKWKHLDSPFGESYVIYARDPEDQSVIGIRALMRWRFLGTESMQLDAVRAVDTATHPSSRRRGVFSGLTRKAMEELTSGGTAFIFNTPNEKSLPGYLKMGWRVVGSLPMYIKVLRPFRFAGGLLSKGPVVRELPPWEYYFGGSIMPWDEFIGRYGDEAFSLADDWESSRGRTGLRTHRSREYLSWRYGGHPFLKYGVCFIKDGKRLAGFAVLKPNIRNGLLEVVINELFLSGMDIDAGVSLLKKAAREVNGDYLIAHFADDVPEMRVIGKSLFIKVPRRGMTFTVRELAYTGTAIFGPDGWDLSLGDLEMF